MDRMLAMARLDNPKGSPFMVGDEQIAWLKKDLAKINQNTPVVVFSHSPIQKIFKPWNFWTQDAEKVQALLKPFEKATVIYGHVHQIQYNQIGNITFQCGHGNGLALAVPRNLFPTGQLSSQNHGAHEPGRPFFERDATGWQFVDVNSGRTAMHYQLPDNKNRTVAYDTATGKPRDLKYQDYGKRIPPQTHF
jgi:Icc protein